MYRKNWCNRRLRGKTLTGDICLSAWVHYFLSSSSSHFTSSPLFPYPMQEQTHLLHHDASLPLSVLSLCWNWQEINPAALIYNPPPPLPPPPPPLLPSRLTPPPGCKVSILDWAQASAQHHALSEPAQRPMGTLFVSISQLQFQRTVWICQAPQNTFMTINKTTEWRLAWPPKSVFGVKCSFNCSAC